MTTLIDPTLRGSGKITGVFFNAAGDVAAVASEFPLLAHPRARAAYGGRRLRYRVALYRRDALVPFAVFDELQYPINDVAFHPTDTTVAIGIGSYDGGFLFEGDLIVWNWRDAHGTHVFHHAPEVVRCRYNARGDELEAWVRPWDEEWGPLADPDTDFDPYDTLFSVRVPAPATGSQPVDLTIDPAAIVPADQRSADDTTNPAHGHEARLQAWFGVDDCTPRDAIRDVAWLDDERFAVLHGAFLLQIHVRHGAPVAAHSFAVAGRGAELLKSKDLLVHVVETGGRTTPVARQDSRLYTLTRDGLRLTQAYDGEFTFSSTPQGRVLGRQNRFNLAGAPPSDVLLDLEARSEHRLDLGHYDCFNHYIGIRNAPQLFLLQGTPASSHERKFLCVVEPDGSVRRLWPILKADNKPASHAMELCGAYIDDALGPGVVISGKHYSPNTTTTYAGFIYRKPLDRDREVWRRKIPASASAIVSMPDAGLIAAAFLDGTLQLIDAARGALRLHARVRVDQWPTVIFSMDARGRSLLVGTVDGRIAVLDIDALCKGGDGGAQDAASIVNLD